MSNFLYNTPLTRNSQDVGILANSDTSVFGMPFRFNELADPHSRIFLSMFSPPPLVTLYPCRVKENVLSNLAPEIKARFEKAIQGSVDEDDAQFRSTIDMVIQSLQTRSSADGRYIVLEPQISEYMNHLRPMLARSFGRLQNQTSLSLSKFLDIKTTGWGGLTYFMTDSSVSESNSNEFSDSMLSGFSKKATGFINEVKALAGNLGIATEDAAEAAAKIQENQAKLTDSVMDGKNGGVFQRATGMISSSHVNFAKIWQDSNFTRNYNITFKFQTPYGDQYSIFRDVLVPTFSLMAMSMPLQTNINSYSAPFFIKADCPGYFTIDTGVITDLSITKSTDTNAWSTNGMLTTIEVSITLMDLYPAMSIAPNLTVLNSNIGTATYIDNISGLDFTRAGAEQTMAHKISAAVGELSIRPQSFIDNTRANTTKFIDQIGNLFIR